MSFSIFPLWLTALLAVGAASIPIIIHLLHRQRTQPVLWGAMQFLRESALQQKRRKKVDHWLLMLLRVGLLVLLVLLLAWPRKDRAFSLLGGGGGTDIGIVIDHSLSTGRHAGNSTVYQQAVASVEQFIKSGTLRATDTVSVVLAEHQPNRVTPLPLAPGGVLNKVVGDLRKRKPGLSDGSVPDAIQATREVIGRGRNGKKVIVVLSDHQRTGWRVPDLTAWNAAVGQRVKGVEPDVRVYEMPILPDAQSANVTVADLTVTPDLVGTSRPTAITATIANTGQREVPACNAKLFVTGRQVAQQPVPALAAGQSKTIRFEHTFAEPYSNWVQVSVDASDSLDEDNRAVASAYVWQQIPVLVIDGQLTSMSLGPDQAGTMSGVNAFKNSRFLVQAMLSDAANPDAPPLVRPTVMSISDRRLNEARTLGVNLDDYSAVVLNDVPQLPTPLANRLLDYARSGHGVWVILGKGAERGYVRDGLAQAGLVSLEPKDDQAAVDVAPAIDVRDPGSPMLSMLVTPEHNAMTGVNTFRWWSVKPRDAEDKVVLAAAGNGNGDPLVIERPVGSNGGRVVVWCTSVDKTWNNWPAMPTFVPLVNLTVDHLAAGQSKGMENRRLESGQPIVWSGPATPAIAKATVTRPDGTKVERRPVTRDGRQILSYGETYLPGKYELSFDQSSVPQPVYYGVGIDRNELDENILTEDDRRWLMSDDHRFVQDQIDPVRGLSAALGAGGDGRDQVWPYLAGFVLATLLGETYLTYRMIRRQTRPGAEVIGATAPTTV